MDIRRTLSKIDVARPVQFPRGLEGMELVEVSGMSATLWLLFTNWKVTWCACLVSGNCANLR